VDVRGFRTSGPPHLVRTGSTANYMNHRNTISEHVYKRTNVDSK